MMQHNINVIAEIGVNHNGDMVLAKELVDMSAEAGANCVKFQTFIAENLASKETKKAEYQIANEGNADESQYDMLKRLELSFDDHFLLKEHAEKRGITFLSTAFGIQELDFLIKDVGLTTIKVGSGDLMHFPMLHRAACAGVNMILSTGMSDLDEVDAALGVLACGYAGKEASETGGFEALAEYGTSNETLVSLEGKVSIMQCTSAYPCPADAVNLNAIDTLARRYGLPTGFSDHTLSEVTGAAAVAKGVAVIEKHVTMDQDLLGPDHLASLPPEAFTRYVANLREVESYLGNGEKQLSSEVKKVRDIAGKRLVAAEDIAQGEIISDSQLRVTRAPKGLCASRYFDLLGTQAKESFSAGEGITKCEA